MSATFELFDTTPCAARLPVNAITDEFKFVRFVTLFDTSQTPLVIPFDVVNPVAAALMRAAYPNVPLSQLRGGVSLNPEWTKVTEPQVDQRKTAASETFTVASVNDFLAQPQVKVGGKTVAATLSADNVRTLRESGFALVAVPDGGAVHLIRVTAKAPKVAGAQRALISDLDAFLSDPTIRLDSGETFSVTLTRSNIDELRSLGVSRVAITDSNSVYVALGVDVSTPAKFADELTGPVTLTSPPPPGPFPSPLPFVFLSLPFALYMPYRQTWELEGYARGALLNSISLSPQEETTIEVFTWDRYKRTSEESLTTESETLAETTITNRDTVETVHDAAQDSGWSVDGKIGVTIPSTPFTVGGGAGTSKTLKDTNKATHELMAEAVQKASVRVKATRQTKVEQSHEFGSEQRVTRKLKNPNMCRTLNLDCFEVVAGHSVSTTLLRDEIRLCVLVPNLIQGAIDRSFLLCHEGVLRTVLREATYLSGFDAIHSLAASQRLCEFKCQATCDCQGTTPKASQYGPHPAPPPTTPRPAPAPPSGAPSTPIDRGPVILTYLTGSVAGGTLTSAVQTPDPTGRVAPAASDLISRIRGLDSARSDSWCASLFPSDDATLTCGRWYFWLIVKQFYNSSWTYLRSFANAGDTSPDALGIMLSKVDLTQIETNNPVFSGIQALSEAAHQMDELCRVKFLLNNPHPDDNGLAGSLTNARAALAAYRAATITPQPTPSGTGTGTSSNGSVQKQDEYSAKDLAEASVAEEQLLSHVRENESYYRNQIWRHLDAEDQARLLSLLGNLDAIVGKQVLGFVGDKAAMPVLIDQIAALLDWFNANVTNGEFGPDPPAQLLILPTPALTMEARLGLCDACEDFIMKHRDLDLQLKTAEVAAAQAHADQEASEAQRYKQRLAGTPPDLDTPTCCDGQVTVRVLLDKPPTP
jgi:hypothetical protein